MNKVIKAIVLMLFAGAFTSVLAQQETPNVQPNFGQYFVDQTLRVNYYRMGNRQHDTVVLAGHLYGFVDKSDTTCGWAGSTTILLDPFNYGSYRVVVKDAATGTPIYSRTYNSLFQEYRDTPAGADSVARFEEVVLVPKPKAAADICLQSRNAKQQFVTTATFRYNPVVPVATLRRGLSRPPVALQYSGDPHKKIDVAIVAEGYGPGDSLKVRADFDKFVSYLFAQEPFASRSADFNVWGVDVLGKGEGITNPGKNLQVNSSVGATYYTFGSERYLMTFNLFKLHDLLDKVPYDHIIIMANSKTYGGGAIYNFYAVSAVQEMSAYILPHELGHSIGGLADEYVDEELSYGGIHQAPMEPLEPNITNLVDFDSKWKKMVAPGTPIPTPDCKPERFQNCGPVGLYEGAGYSAKNLYRPVMNCMMRAYGPFCPVCTQALNDMFDIYCR